MRWLFALILATAGGLAPIGAASAQQVDPATKTVYVACYVYTIGQSSADYLPVFRSTAYEMFHNLENKVYLSVLPHPQPGQTLGCKTGDTPEAAEAARLKTGYVRTSDLPWPKDLLIGSMAQRPPSGAAVVETAIANPKPTPPPRPAQAASLTVKTDTSLRDAATAWDEQVKRTLAAEAKKKVETAAKTAQADAKYKAEVEAFFAERRRQGRAQ